MQNDPYAGKKLGIYIDPSNNRWLHEKAAANKVSISGLVDGLVSKARGVKAMSVKNGPAKKTATKKTPAKKAATKKKTVLKKAKKA